MFQNIKHHELVFFSIENSSVFRKNANVFVKNDPVAFRKRTSLNLPAPQVSDGELEEIVKMGSTLMPPPEVLQVFPLQFLDHK